MRDDLLVVCDEGHVDERVVVTIDVTCALFETLVCEKEGFEQADAGDV